jgi:hypothetical protein
VIFCNVKNKVNFWQLKQPKRDISSLFCGQMTKLVKEETLVPTTKLMHGWVFLMGISILSCKTFTISLIVVVDEKLGECAWICGPMNVSTIALCVSFLA